MVGLSNVPLWHTLLTDMSLVSAVSYPHQKSRDSMAGSVDELCAIDASRTV